jgi:protease-4
LVDPGLAFPAQPSYVSVTSQQGIRMIFARKVWKLLVAVKDGLALLFLLLFFGGLFAVLTTRPSPGAVQAGALLLKLNGTIVEEPALRDPLQALLSSNVPTTQYRTRDIVQALESAATDDRIKAVVLDLSKFMGGGQVSMTEVGAAMDKVRAAKKPVLTWAVGYADDAMLLAAHASEVWVDPLGGAFVVGPGGNRLYYGQLLDRFKVTAHVFKVGTFKDAVEPYVRNAMSDPSREARRALYASVWEQWQVNVKQARPKADLARVTSDPVAWLKASGGDAAQAALAAGLVDKVGDKVAFGERVKALVGADPLDELPGKYAHSALEPWLAANPVETPGEAIPVVTVAGEIVDGKAGPGTAGGDRIAKLIDEATASDAPALVLRVDSPGGSVMASEAIRTALVRFKAGKAGVGNGKARPVAVSMANLAASGGYWVATPGNRIFAEPDTITGSIGIFAVFPSFERALADYGVTGDGVQTTPLSGQPDLLTGLTPEVSAMIQSNIESNYGRFLGLVGTARGKTPQAIDTMAQGRVWDGGTARQLGLVDEFGGLDTALAWTAKQAGLADGDWHPAYLGNDADPYASLLDMLLGDDDEADSPGGSGDFVALTAQRQQAGLQQAVAGLERLFSGRGAQAYCLDCDVPVQSAVQAKPLGWMAQLGAMLGLR